MEDYSILYARVVADSGNPSCMLVVGWLYMLVACRMKGAESAKVGYDEPFV